MLARFTNDYTTIHNISFSSVTTFLTIIILMPQSQRDLFKEFYKRIVTLGGEKVDIVHIF